MLRQRRVRAAFLLVEAAYCLQTSSAADAGATCTLRVDAVRPCHDIAGRLAAELPPKTPLRVQGDKNCVFGTSHALFPMNAPPGSFSRDHRHFRPFSPSTVTPLQPITLFNARSVFSMHLKDHCCALAAWQAGGQQLRVGIFHPIATFRQRLPHIAAAAPQQAPARTRDAWPWRRTSWNMHLKLFYL